MRSFLIRAGGRMMRVTPLERFMATDAWWVPVDVRDLETRITSQAIVAEALAGGDPLTLMADGQMRDCVRSVHMNAVTNWQDGRPKMGARLPGDFPIEVETPARWDTAGIAPRES